MKSLLRDILGLIALLTLAGSGCSTARVAGGSVPVEDQSSSAAGVPGAAPAGAASAGPAAGVQGGTAAAPESPAVVALLDTAQLDMDNGRPESAAATLERALRLEPKNSLLWHRLALIRQQQQQWRQVMSLAQKSNSLATGDRYLQLQNWRLIALAREHLNDAKGVEQARGMIEKLTKDY